MIASNSYPCPIWVLPLGTYLTCYFCVAYLHAAIPRYIFISDNLECFSPRDTFFFGNFIPSTNYLSEMY